MSYLAQFLQKLSSQPLFLQVRFNFGTKYASFTAYNLFYGFKQKQNRAFLSWCIEGCVSTSSMNQLVSVNRNAFFLVSQFVYGGLPRHSSLSYKFPKKTNEKMACQTGIHSENTKKKKEKYVC